MTASLLGAAAPGPPAPSIDVAWEGIPNWIAASAAVLTFVVALVAAAFAYHAWRAAVAQSVAGERQAEAAEKQLRIASDQAELFAQQIAHQTDRDFEARRREIQAQIDAIAPSVLATAEINDLLGSHDGRSWYPILDPKVLEGDEQQLFKLSAKIRLQNTSSHPARLAFPDAEEFGLGSGREMVIEPNGERSLSWSRTVLSEAIRRPEDPSYERTWHMVNQVWVRDLGLNVRDTLQFNLDFRYFELDGSRLLVRPTVLFPDQLKVAEPIGPRLYERIEGGAPMASPIGEASWLR